MDRENFNFCLFVLFFMGLLFGVCIYSLLQAPTGSVAGVAVIATLAVFIATMCGVRMAQDYYDLWKKS